MNIYWILLTVWDLFDIDLNSNSAIGFAIVFRYFMNIETLYDKQEGRVFKSR